MGLHLLMAFDASQYAWNPSLGIPFDDPVFWVNLAGLIVGILLLAKLKDQRGLSNVGDGAWWAGVVFVAGTGLHFLLDLVNFPEQGDHLLIHVVVLVALVTFFVFARREA